MFFTFEFCKKAGRVSNAPCQIDILLIFDFFYVEIIKFGGGTHCEQSKKGTGKGHGVGTLSAKTGRNSLAEQSEFRSLGFIIEAVIAAVRLNFKINSVLIIHFMAGIDCL